MKKISRRYIAFLYILIVLIITACNTSKSGAVQAIEAYIQALGNKDQAQISGLSCSDWEAQALVELDSLGGVGSKVENLACKESGHDNNDVYVSCTGTLALDYNGEAQQIDLSARTYVARQAGGEWQMCGYH